VAFRMTFIAMFIISSIIGMGWGLGSLTPPVRAQTPRFSMSTTLPQAPARALPSARVRVPEPSALAVRYHESGNVLWAIATIWGLALPAMLFFTGVSARLRTWAVGIGRRWYFILVIYVTAFTLVLFAANLPLDFYADFWRPHAYGLSSQDVGKWLHDELIGLALSVIAAALLIWIPYLLLKVARERWWLYTWIISLPVLFAVSVIEPIWIEPLFNDFGRMKDPALEARVLALAHRAGIDDASIFQVNKSVDTNELNAYVTGIGSTKRIVLWDTLIKETTPAELSAVLGHEMGHYVLNHVWKGLLLAGAGLLAALWLVHRCVDWTLHRHKARSGVANASDIASLPLFMFIFGMVSFVFQPAALAYSRHLEHEADRFGLEITHDNHACATVFAKFVEHDLAYPSPGLLFVLWRSSHPPLAERIEFCNDYHPWLEGKPQRYSRYIQDPQPGPSR